MPCRFITTLIIVLFPILLLAQQIETLSVDSTATNSFSHPTPAKKRSDIIVIRGTVLPYLIGNDAGIAFSIGGEYIFWKHHSIGIDGFLHVAQGSHDNITDTTGVLHETGSVHHSTEKAIFVNYRYYFNYKNLKRLKGPTLYISPYYRYGYHEWHDDPLYKVEYVLKRERSYSEGILLGFLWSLEKTKRSKIDFNIGPFQKRKEITTYYLENGVIKEKAEQLKTHGLRIGVFFTYLFYRDN